MKSIISFFLTLFVSLQMVANTSGQPLKIISLDTPPKVAESEKLLKLPNRFYYVVSTTNDGIDGQRVHCYSSNTKEDVTLDIWIPEFFGQIEALWYSPESNSAYIAINEGGNSIREITIYKISPTHVVSSVLTLNGYLPTSYNDYDTTSMCGVEVKKDYIEIYGYTDSGQISKVLSYDLQPIKVLPPSQMQISPLGLEFVKVNTDGVNIRKYPDTKAPRWGYFYCVECEDTDRENPPCWEDDPEGHKPFTPFHPEAGKIYPFSSLSSAEGWQPVICGYEPEGNGYISSKFVDKVISIPITPDYKFSNNGLPNDISTIDKGKYKGLWTYFESAMEGDYIYIGKIVDGIIVFYGSCPAPYYNSEVKGLVKTEYGLDFGPDLAKVNSWGGMDFKIDACSDAQLDLLFSLATVNTFFTHILVAFPETEYIFTY